MRALAERAAKMLQNPSRLGPNRDRCSLIILSTSDFTKSNYFQNRSVDATAAAAGRTFDVTAAVTGRTFDATAAAAGRTFDAAAPTNGATAARTGGAAASATTMTGTTHRRFLLLVSLVI